MPAFLPPLLTLAALARARATARLAIAARLEESGDAGHASPAPSALRRVLGDVWGRVARVARPLRLPPGCRVIGVGGATLGGSGKTPLAIAIAEALSLDTNGHVVLVGHGHGARVARARVVAPSGDGDAGDEARLMVERLPSVPVVIGPTRQEAVDFAATLGDVLVVDGLLQTTPVRLDLSILAVDARAPWGAGACPPAGDLRARAEDLLGAADCVVAVGSDPPSSPFLFARARYSLSGPLAPSSSPGLFVSVARPDRVLRTLEQLGVTPLYRVRAPDHEPRAGLAEVHAVIRRVAQLGGAPVQWILTEKCLAGLGGPKEASALLGRDHLVLRQHVELPEEIRHLLHRPQRGLP